MDMSALKETLQTTVSDIKAAVEKRDGELKRTGEVTEQTRKALNDATARLEEIKSEINKEAEERKKIDQRLIEIEKAQKRRFEKSSEAKSLGERFINSDVYQNVKKSGRGTGEPFKITRKELSSTNVGALVTVDRRPNVILNQERPRRVRDLFASVPTDSSAVEFMRQLSFTNNAAPQAGDWATKPQSDLRFELQTIPIRTIAHWIAASRQVLSDARMLQGIIDNQLIYGLQLVSDDQLLYGDGTGQNLTGLMSDPAVSDIGAMAAADVNETVEAAMLDHIRAAITECQINNFYNVNGLILNPVDWASLETAKGTDGHYIWVSVPDGGEPRLWRVPVVVSNAMRENEFVLGDFTLGATVFDREELDVRISESHAQFFVQNGVAILAEERYGLGIQMPKAFTKGRFLAAA